MLTIFCSSTDCRVPTSAASCAMVVGCGPQTFCHRAPCDAPCPSPMPRSCRRAYVGWKRRSRRKTTRLRTSPVHIASLILGCCRLNDGCFGAFAIYAVESTLDGFGFRDIVCPQSLQSIFSSLKQNKHFCQFTQFLFKLVDSFLRFFFLS